jgi:hypothetical protein
MTKRSRRRTPLPSASKLIERVEQLTDSLMDVCAEERRLIVTLERLRRVKRQLVAELATSAAEATEASVRGLANHAKVQK